MNYYVYANYSNRRVRVHTGRCGYCNEGKGKSPTRYSKDKWHGPLDTLEVAQAFAKKLKVEDTLACQICLLGSKPASTW